MRREAFRGRAYCAFAICGLGLPAITGCIIEDGDKACGPNQVKMSSPGARYCECAPGFVLDPKDDHGCIPCGENEESIQGECQCVEGYARPSEGAPCGTSTLGTPCSPSEPCMGEFPLCVEGSGSASEQGYCTSQGCKSSDECMLPGWLCVEASGSANELEAASLCKKPPQGYGKDCAETADCAGSEATYCDTFRTHACLVEGCGKGKPCPGDWSCCDLAPFAPMPICFEPRNLTNGNCPVGSLVKP